MAYRFDKQENGKVDLVIDGFENGIADSPFVGIGNIRNLNVRYYQGVAYVNYKRQAATVTGGTMSKPLAACQSPAGIIYIVDDSTTPQIFKQSAVNSSTFALLSGNASNVPINEIAFWNNYLFTFSGDLNGRIEICGDGTGDAGVTSSNWNSPSSSPVNFTVTIATPAVFTSNAHGLSAGDNIRLTTTGALPTGLSANTNYYVISAGLTTNTFEVSTSVGGSAVNTTGSQSGTHSYTVARGVWPIKNTNTMVLTNPPAVNDTTATISSYTDFAGVTRTVWNGPTGYYNVGVNQGNGTSDQIVLALFTQGSSTITWTPGLNVAATSTTVSFFYNGALPTSTSVAHSSLVSANTGDLYFCNGPNIGAFTLNINQRFNKNNMGTFTFYANILALPQSETSVALTELRNELIIAGKKTLYPWDFFSIAWGTPVPMDEDIKKMINILNNVYIFAGNKGNIYQSNGYSIARFKKMPDYVAGVTDPAWNWGGVMSHRQMAYFQALATNSQTGTNLLSGIFSLNLDTGVLVMENQNSGGLAPTGIVSTGVLIDDNSTAINYDKYYSAYGATASSIDFNDTTLYSASEPLIETDIVPVGTFLQNKTYASAEFKLDQPLQSGDSINLYARQSLTDTYTLLGTTTTAVLSDCFQNMPIERFQWIQFKVTFSCNSGAASSSFCPLRELRIR